MSAYVVNKEHVDVLVMLALRGPSGRAVCPDNAWHGPSWLQNPEEEDWREHRWLRVDPCVRTGERPDRISADDLGQLLVSENVISVSCRYPNDELDELPGARPAYWLDPYEFTDHRINVTAVEGLSALDGYEYQACEHSDWPESEAYRFCMSLRKALVHAVDGYDAAPWCWDAEKVAQRRAGQLVGRH